MTTATLKIGPKERQLLYAYGVLTYDESRQSTDSVDLEIKDWVYVICTLRREGNLKRETAKNIQRQLTMEMWCNTELKAKIMEKHEKEPKAKAKAKAKAKPKAKPRA